DIIMPRMSGVKLLRAIREVSEHVQVIMITGEPTIETVSEALRLGAFDYLAKPVTKEAIVKTVNNAAATKTLTDEKRRLEAENLNYQKNLEKLVEERTEQLLDAAENWKNTFDAIEDLVGLISPDCDFVEVNKAICDFTGLSPEELRGRKCYEVIHGTEEPIKDCPVSKAKKSLKGETSEIFQDGNCYAVSASPVIDESGRLTGFTHVVKDITDGKRAEADLRESEEQFRDLYKNVNIGLYRTTPDGRIILANPVIVKMLGYSSIEELNALNLEHDFFTPNERKEFRNMAESEGRIERLESQWRRRDGSVIDVCENAVLIRDEKGNPLYYDGTVEDITKRKKAEEDFKALSLLNEAILASVPDIIMETDNNKVYNWANNAGYNFFGEDVLGKEAADYFIGEQDTYKIVQPLFNGSDETIYIESWQRRKDGETRLLGWWCRTLKDVYGHVIGNIATARDITEQKQADEILRKSEEQLSEAQAVAHIGHWELDPEVGTPVWSDEIFRIFGLNPQEGEPSFVNHETHIHPDDWSILNEAVTRLSTEGGSFDIEFRIERPDDTIVWMHAIGNTIRDKKGKTSKLFGTAQDITLRIQAERDLQKLNDTLEAAQKMAKLGYWRFDIELQMPTWSDEMFKLRGYKKEDGVPREDEHKQTMHPDDWGFFDKAVQACTQGTPYNVVVRMRFQDGTYHYINTQGFPVYGEKGEIIEIFGTSQDITELKLAEEVLRQSEERYRTLTENMKDVVFATDNQGKISFIT
ncbi:MAG: PAS domain S-box protein, partial [Calditrichaeota bacterium]|nr:PAS domain S-box protein [Calditrichota bacterium]